MKRVDKVNQAFREEVKSNMTREMTQAAENQGSDKEAGYGWLMLEQ